jgi:hypothetical protein|tara:strand:- start:275 stop:508 length:234 start_codon:yes stop_codon:yes gene_type:complete
VVIISFAGSDIDTFEKRVVKVRDLQRGEVIHQVNQKPIWDPNELAKVYKAAKGQDKKSLLMLVEGANGFRFSILKVK